MQPRQADVTTPPTSGADPQSTDAGTNPAEGRPDLGLPGADRPDVPPGPQDDLPERLGQRIENGSSSGLATGEPDVLPDVEVPDETM
ncbi:MAG TPA: hypothetical protein VFP56_00375 [Candidatus Limnocylindrales bacterium]|nr:hypothetical protein [Candidatus Limnocylindrales bacterium]